MSLLDRIISRIHSEGPISLSDYMTDCLLHPDLGYYTTRDPLGVAGDFTTAPEISQMFGELIGLSLAQSWLDQGRPDPFTLAELGPGRGTLMADLLRATRAVPGFNQAAQLWLVEASPPLRDEQARRLAAHSPAWTDTVADLPGGPLFLVANEFFDALPVRQFVRDQQGWRERRIGVRDGQLVFGLGQRQDQPPLSHRLDDTKDGDLVEFCPAAPAIMQEIGGRIFRSGGTALIIDYGDWRSQGDTLQALRSHTYDDPLKHPGQADLTAHVDFEALALASPSAHTRLTAQGVFLERLGITQRAQMLANGKPPEEQNAIAAAHRRLTHPAEMGTLFKVIGLYPGHATPPAGLMP